MCMCMLIFECAQICTRLWVCEWVSACVYVCVCVCLCVCVCVYVYVCFCEKDSLWVSVGVRIWVCVYVCTCVFSRLCVWGYRTKLSGDRAAIISYHTKLSGDHTKLCGYCAATQYNTLHIVTHCDRGSQVYATYCNILQHTLLRRSPAECKRPGSTTRDKSGQPCEDTLSILYICDKSGQPCGDTLQYTRPSIHTPFCK